MGLDNVLGSRLEHEPLSKTECEPKNAQIPGDYILYGGAQYLSVLSLELAPCHSSEA